MGNNISMLDGSCIPSAVTCIVQCLEAAAIAVVPNFQNDHMARRRKGAAVYGHNIAYMKRYQQIWISIAFVLQL